MGLRTAVLLISLLLPACATHRSIQQGAGQREAIYALNNIYRDLKKLYYDPQLRGQDMAAHYERALREVEQAGSQQERYAALSNFMDQLDDSHTFYIGYTPVALSDYGFGVRFYGETPIVSGTDEFGAAHKAGLRRGDEIVTFAGRPITRTNYRRIIKNFLAQEPIPVLPLQVRTPSQSLEQFHIAADTLALNKLTGKDFRRWYAARRDSLERSRQHVMITLHEQVMVWRLPNFNDAEIGLGKAMNRARQHGTLIIDLRGNPGGIIANLAKVVGGFVEREIEVGTMQMRWDEKEYVAKPRGDRFTGKLIILVDSQTGSSAEVFARMMQIERQALVIGDRTAGAVMAAMGFRYHNSFAWISVSDFVLFNGERLEKKGVQPDEVLIPTPQQIADGEDPVLARALALSGITITPAQAADLYRIK